jgi:ribosomal protein S18 acetylase RimI-like enzyme
VENELSRVLAFSHAIEDGSATTLVPFRYGTAVFNSEYPHSWMHNFLRIDAAQPTATAAALAEEADRLQGGARHAHRAIVVEDEKTGARLRPSLVERGYKAERNVIMVRRRPPDRVVDTSVVEQVDFERLRPLLEEYYRAEPYGDDEEVVRQLVDRGRLTATVVDVKHFAVSVEGRAVSSCDLYTSGRIAQIEDVTTLESYRGRGYARAAVTRALEEAAGADLVFLYADEDDWPKDLYRKLGFEPLALMYLFTRSIRSPRSPSSDAMVR